MNKTLWLSLCLAVASLMAQAGEEAPRSCWTVATLPDAAKGAALRGVCFVGENGWIVGDKGLCLLTKDGGKVWKASETGSGATLRCVRFKDANNGWACGEGDPKAPPPRGHVVGGVPMLSGTILRTTDGGGTWTNYWVPTNFELPAVEVSAAPVLQLGISGGEVHLDGDIIRSHNAGQNWDSDRCFRALFDIRAVDAQRWIAVGSPVSVGFMPPPTSPLYLKNTCRILVSADGGKDWDPAKGADGSRCLRGLAVTPAGQAMAVGDGAAILRSTDAGQNWEKVPCKIPRNLSMVAFAEKNPKMAVAVGAAGGVLVSLDEGSTWHAVAGPGEGDLYCVTASGDGFWTVGAGGVVAFVTAAALEKAPEVELKPVAGTAPLEDVARPRADPARNAAGFVRMLETQLKRDPTLASQGIYVQLGGAKEAAGDSAGAMEAYQKAVEAQPEDAQANNALAWALLTIKDEKLRDPAKALPVAEKANTLAEGKDPAILDTLGLAYFKNGKVPEAIAAQKKAIGLLPASLPPAHRKEYEDRLKEFEAAGEKKGN